MRCKENKRFIIDYMADAITGKDEAALMGHIRSCEKCRLEFEELKTVGTAAQDYFTQTKVPYNNDMEEKIVQDLITEQESFLSGIKRFFYVFRPVLRPVMIFMTVALLFVTGFRVHTMIERNKIIKEISGIIDINEDAIDFVVFNNMDYVIQLYIQEQSEISVINIEDIHSNIKYSLYIYLRAQMEKEYFNKNWGIIDSTLNMITEEYYNYIRENHSILI